MIWSRTSSSKRKAPARVRPDAPSERIIESLQIELTNHCNYKCHFCPQSHYRKPEFAETPFERDKGYMTYDLYRKVLDQAFEVAREINFSFFGEPMMHPEFLRFLDCLADRPAELRVVMNTNLSYATREYFDKLIAIGLNELRISIDAADAATYDIVRPGKHYVDLEGSPRTGTRFETICDKAAYWFDRTDHRPTRHVYTVNSRNLNNLEPYVKRWGPVLGADDCILAKNVLTYGGKIADTLVHEHACNVWDHNWLTVDWTGKVSPCNLDTNMDLAIGSVENATLLELHQSSERQRIERLSKARDITPCRTCVDGNNWDRNLIFKQGDNWNEACQDAFSASNQAYVPLTISAS